MGKVTPEVSNETTDINNKGGQDMKEYTLEIKGEPDIRFTGTKIASDENERHLYKTRGGKYICYRTLWMSEHGDGLDGWLNISYAICETTDEVTEFFGYTETAKDLYREAGIDATFEVA